MLATFMLQKIHIVRVAKGKYEMYFLFLFWTRRKFSHKLRRRDMEQKYRMYGKVLLSALQDTFGDVSTHLSVSPTLLRDDGPMGGWMAPNTSA